MARKKKKVEPKIDGINPKDIQNIRKALRQVWTWSQPARLVRLRCLLKNGFSKCELCKKKCAKVFVDHIKVMGDVLAPDYIKRMWTSSKELQGLCKQCHDKKTREEKKAAKKAAEDELDFY